MKIFDKGTLVWVRQGNNVFKGIIQEVVYSNKKVYGYILKDSTYTHEVQMIYESEKLAYADILINRIEEIFKDGNKIKELIVKYNLAE